MNKIYTEALKYIRQMLGPDADFRKDQFEAIEKILTDKRLLVVEKTGWGKSLVYFISTRILRDTGKGPAILISPLLSLMRNQIDNAGRLGLKALSLNSDTMDQKDHIIKCLARDECDILLISPERLANKDDMNSIMGNIPKGIGLFVVDEAHCISDWGHDFRPDYRRIISIVQTMPPNVPILATTATANQRVIDDIVEQLGDIQVMRGSLMRESLSIQVIRLDDQAERLAWLSENIPDIKGNGIVYCLTRRDTEKVTEWLCRNGISAVSYTGDTENRSEIEEAFMNNEMKCLVATVALGMGYDKPDIGFVIHYQRPGNIVSYYQQIGRAGRQIENAYAVLLSGREDDAIQEYFIRSAFPTESEMTEVVELLESAENGMKKREMLKMLNISSTRLNACLKYLTVENVIEKENAVYFRTVNRWSADDDRSRSITYQRYRELDEMKEYIKYTGCYMRFLAERLDDTTFHECGRCTNCLGENFFPDHVSEQDVISARSFLRSCHSKIYPRRQYPDGKRIAEKNRLEEGRTLCDYGDSGWGKYMHADKYINGYVRPDIINASASLIKKWLPDKLENLNIAYVPSKRQPRFVMDFALKLAGALGINCLHIIGINGTGNYQKDFNNSAFKYANANENFFCTGPADGNILLVDDIVDSKWTLTACGLKLKKAGADKVFPFAITSSSGREGKTNGNK